MGKIVLENVEEDTLDRLRALASVAGRSVEDEVKRIVEAAVSRAPSQDREALIAEFRRIRAMSPPVTGIDVAQLIREDRDR